MSIARIHTHHMHRGQLSQRIMPLGKVRASRSVYWTTAQAPTDPIARQAKQMREYFLDLVLTYACSFIFPFSLTFMSSKVHTGNSGTNYNNVNLEYNYTIYRKLYNLKSINITISEYFLNSTYRTRNISLTFKFLTLTHCHKCDTPLHNLHL